jgi:hypothetical protein
MPDRRVVQLQLLGAQKRRGTEGDQDQGDGGGGAVAHGARDCTAAP